MIPAESFSISASGNYFLIILFIILLVLYTFYIYKYTIPNVSAILKTFLVILRSLIFILILLMIFEPVISITSRSNVESKTFVFIDNSNSIAAKDSTGRKKRVDGFIEKINSRNGIKFQLFSFGQKIDSINGESSKEILFDHTQTNFANIIDLVKKKDAAANSVVIISDGIITDGVDPTYQAEKLQVPIFTIGIGDSTEKKDVMIYNILYNQFIYAGKATAIEAAVKNNGFENKPVRVTLYEEEKLLESKDVLLSNTGLNKINFNYKPANGGEKKLRISITPLAGEFTSANNNRVFYLNVLDTKLKVCLIAGSPSADLSAISKALSTDKNIQVKKLIQISSNKFWNDEKFSVIDSAGILFMIDFPNANTPQNLIDKTAAAVGIQNKPFFILLTGNVNINRLRPFDKSLPFSFKEGGNEVVQIQPEIMSDVFSTYFSTASGQQQIWNNLPPITQPAMEFLAKPGSYTLVKSKVRNIPIGNPLIVTRSLGKQRSFSILAGDIWRWQLQTAEKYPEFFDNFINDIVKWLNASSEQKQFSVTTDKKIYSPNEEINFTTQLYDQTFSAIDTAHIQLQISKGEKKFDLTPAAIGNGIYISAFSITDPGDYSYYAATQLGSSIIKSNTGRFSISDVSIEKIDTRMRPAFLRTLANSTSGEYYSIDNYSRLMNKLIDENNDSKKEYIAKSEYQLWSHELMLLIIVFLFTAEWFVRKRSGMI